jgi:hypothetical protein
MRRALIGSDRLGLGCLVLRADTRENPGGKNGVMTMPITLLMSRKCVFPREKILPMVNCLHLTFGLNIETLFLFLFQWLRLNFQV